MFAARIVVSVANATRKEAKFTIRNSWNSSFRVRRERPGPAGFAPDLERVSKNGTGERCSGLGGCFGECRYGGNGRGALIFRRCQGCLGIPAEKFHDFLTLAKPLLKQQGQRLRVGGLAGGSSQASGWLMAVGSLKESKASSRRYRERKTSSAFLFCSSESAVKPSSTSTRTDTS